MRPSGAVNVSEKIALAAGAVLVTTALAGDVTERVPRELCARTFTRRRSPAASAGTVMVRVVAPASGEQPVPSLEHVSHW